jgi:hypothetical protein
VDAAHAHALILPYYLILQHCLLGLFDTPWFWMSEKQHCSVLLAGLLVEMLSIFSKNY